MSDKRVPYSSVEACEMYLALSPDNRERMKKLLQALDRLHTPELIRKLECSPDVQKRINDSIVGLENLPQEVL